MSLSEIKDIASILGSAGQFLFGSIAVTISILALRSKRKDIFKTELSKAQFSEMGKIREQLSEIFFDVYYVKEFKSDLDALSYSLDDMKEKMPEQWQQYQNYKTKSLDVFYKLGTPDYYLFPEWIDSKTLSEHYKTMLKFAPFSIIATHNQKNNVLAYQNSLLNLINHIDMQLRKNA